MKRCGLILVAVSAILLPLLASCAAPTPAPTPGPTRTPTPVAGRTEIPAPEGPVTVVLWHSEAASGQGGRLLREMCDRFHQEYPLITVEPVYAGRGEDLRIRITAAIQAGSPPDLAVAGPGDIAGFMRAGAIVPLDPYIQDPEIGLTAADREDILPGCRQMATFPEFAGSTLSFPFALGAEALYYNLTALKAAGIKAPPKTWDEFEKACEAATKGNVRGYAYVERQATFDAWLVARGASELSADYTRAAFNGPEGVESVELLSRLIRDAAAWKPGGAGADLAAFARGQAAFAFGSTGSIPALARAIKDAGQTFDWGVTIVPQQDGAAPRTVLSGGSLCLLRTTGARQWAAWQFVKWFTATEQAAQWSAQTGYLPVRKSAAAALAGSDWAAKNKVLAQAYAEVAPFACPTPNVRGEEAIGRLIETAWSAAATGGKEPKEALDEAAGKADELLANNGP